jgi:hypothetical protein
MVLASALQAIVGIKPRVRRLRPRILFKLCFKLMWFCGDGTTLCCEDNTAVSPSEIGGFENPVSSGLYSFEDGQIRCEFAQFTVETIVP